MNSKDKGNLSEAKALLEFQKFNIPVLIPWSDNLRYDMVIELNKQFYRIQVKTANEEINGSVKCYTRSSKNHTTNKELKTYINEVDYFVFYNQVHDKIAIVPIEEVGDRKVFSLRLVPPINNQKCRYFDDYSFEKILGEICGILL